jgi:serine/threonine-protein kinase RsbW
MERFIKIESSTNKICEVEHFLNFIFNEVEIDKKLYFNIFLSLNEAVNNAIQHGNQFDLNKHVIISFYTDFIRYEFTVEDEGSGFSLDILKDPTNLDNIRNESGRGIFIMKKYSDDIEFLENGKKIKLIFINRD